MEPIKRLLLFWIPTNWFRRKWFRKCQRIRKKKSDGGINSISNINYYNPQNIQIEKDSKNEKGISKK